MVEVRVYTDEITVLLEGLPNEIKMALRRHFENIFDHIRSNAFQGVPRKYLDPRQMETGITDIGRDLTIGFLEYSDKDGVYSIAPINHRFLYSRERQFFAWYVSRHPYPRGAAWIQLYLQSQMPWIENELQGLEDELSR